MRRDASIGTTRRYGNEDLQFGLRVLRFFRMKRRRGGVEGVGSMSWLGYFK